MVRNALAAIFVSPMIGCTIAISPEAILVGDDAYRRTDFQALDIQNTDLLPDGVRLRHGWLDSEIGPLALSWAQQEEGRQADRLIVYCMGNTTDRQSDGADYLAGVLPFGDALIFDYTGYGDSAGPASLEAFESALSAVAARVEQETYDDVLVWGHSMGGLFCAQMATRLEDRLSGVVFEATFSDVGAISRHAVPWYLKPFIRL
ncbi:MAG: alpha/beta fold hydrolase [Pseudomonadota bacterium]